MKLLQKDPAGLNEKEALAKSMIQSGVELYGFLSGLFGRGNYGPYRVVFNGPQYIQVEDYGGVILTSRDIDGEHYTWSRIVNDSNEALKEELEEEIK